MVTDSSYVENGVYLCVVNKVTFVGNGHGQGGVQEQCSSQLNDEFPTLKALFFIAVGVYYPLYYTTPHK